MRIELLCVICCQEVETTGHLLWPCPLARNVWTLARGKLQKLPNVTQDFLLLFSTIKYKAGVEGYGEMGDDKLGHLEC